MAEGVATGGFGDAAGLDRSTHGALQVGVVGMMAAGTSERRVDAQFGGGEDVLPAPFSVGVGIFAFQGIGR